MILVRTRAPTPEAEALARGLAAASGREAALVVDATRGAVGGGELPVLSLTRRGLRALGLHAPANVGWLCGDYGFYLARAARPEAESFWLVEDDVRILDPEAFFRIADADPALDLIAGGLRPAEADWWWSRAAVSRDGPAWRCFFPVVRLSARAVDALLERRRAHAAQPVRRGLWPNDESFVATTLERAGFLCADINALAPGLYAEESYGFDRPMRAEDLPGIGAGPRLLHPVLTGEAYERKRRALARPTPLPERLARRLLPPLARRLPW